MQRFETAIIGGGIVGLATAAALAERGGGGFVVLEAEDRLAAHQTGRNSGVIHSGLYYRPGSLKARLCTEGREALYRFCAERGIAHERCGKVVVAADRRQAALLADLQRRGQANGLAGLRWLDAGELAGLEPHAAAVAALHVPQTGIVDFAAVAGALAEVVRAAGGQVRCGARVVGARREGEILVVETTRGALACRRAVNCAGLHADRVARLFGARPACRIVPVRGEYRRLAPGREHLVRNLIYPVPDPGLPFLGVHLSRRIGQGGVEVGPNAVLALARHGYRRFSVDGRDLLEMLGDPGFWRMAGRYWRAGLIEISRSLSRGATARAARRLVPQIRADDLRPGPSGVRAQAVDRRGRLLDDFCIVRAGPAVHVLNAPSPAATAALSIGRYIAGQTATP